MFFLLPILIFAALAVNSLASPYTGWPVRARNEVGSLRVRKEEFKIHSRTESSHRNFSLPLSNQQQPPQKSDDTLVDQREDQTTSPDSLRNLNFLTSEGTDAPNVYNASTTSTIPIRPRNAFAIRQRFRPGQKTDSLSNALIHNLVTRQANDSSDDSSNSSTIIAPGSPISGLSAKIPSSPGFNATVLSPDGTDITSNFKIMFYQSPNIVALDELNGKTKRQTGVGERVQNKCSSGTAIFHYSHCTPKGSAGTTQTYQVWCRERSTKVGTARPVRYPAAVPGGRAKTVMKDQYYRRPKAEPSGICAEDEICLDSPQPWVDPNDIHEAMYTEARCVSTRLFRQLPSSSDLYALRKDSGSIQGMSIEDLTALDPSGSENEPGSSRDHQAAFSSQQNLAGSMMSMRLTTVDERPLPANVEVDMGRARSSNSEGTIENHACRAPCMDMSTTGFPVNTDWVSTHARLLSTAVTLGVMWVAFFH